MKSRRICREVALQALYQCDVTGDWSVQSAELCLAHFFSHGSAVVLAGELDGASTQDHSFCLALITGVQRFLPEIDAQIGLASTHWSIARMSRVDRNILRLAVYELRFRPDIPPKVAINEAIEIAKDFSSDDAPTFINGVLDRIFSSSASRELSGMVQPERDEGVAEGEK